MKGFKRYERYKDSGVEWIGEIPEHWNLSRFKNYIKLINEKVESNELDLHYVGLENIESFTGKLIEGASYIGEGVSIIFTPKDVLFGKLRPYLAKVLLPSFNGRCSTELLVLRPIDNSLVDRSYLYYYCLSDGFINIVNSSTYGARMPRTSWDFISLLTLTLPSLHEQKAIAIFLNQKTAEIDSLIADKEKLIELLQEKRQAIITQAVTKGLDPNVLMKDSGVEWIGEIPEHWAVVKTKYLADKIGSGKTPIGGSENYLDEGIIFLRSQNVYDDGLRLDDIVFISEEIDKEMSNSRVKPNDILLNITGASIGRTCIYPLSLGRANVNQHVCIIRPNTFFIEPEYLAYVFKSEIIKQQIYSSQNGSSREGLNFEQVGNLVFPLPDRKEQKVIINTINKAIYDISDTITNINCQIGKIKEYRQSLITAAVTGKIDVRDYFNEGEEKEEQVEVS